MKLIEVVNELAMGLRTLRSKHHINRGLEEFPRMMCQEKDWEVVEGKVTITLRWACARTMT